MSVMRLDEYLKEIGKRPYQFADEHGIKRDSVYNVLRGRGGKLTLDMAIRIASATDGKVSLVELTLGSPDWRPTARYKLARSTRPVSRDVPFQNLIEIIKKKKAAKSKRV